MNRRTLLNIRNRLVFGSLVGIVLVALNWFGVDRPLEELIFDQYLRFAPERESVESVQLIAIDDEDVDTLGQWPFPRGAHVNVVQILHALQVKNICFDVVFSEPSRDLSHDQAFHDIVTSAANVTLAYYFQDLVDRPVNISKPHFAEGSRYGVDPSGNDFLYGQYPKPLYAEFETPLGAVNAKQTSGDKIVRRIPLFIAYDKKLYPTIAMQSVIQAYELESDQIRIEPGKYVMLVGTPRGQIKIPIDEHCQMRVKFDAANSLLRKSQSYIDLFRIAADTTIAEEAMPLFKDSVTFVGNSSTGNTDVVLTRNGPMPGVLIQALVAENIMSGNFLRTLPKPVSSLIILMASILAALGIRGAYPWRTLGLLVLLVAVWTIVTLIASRQGLILPYVSVVAAVLLTMLLLYPTQLGHIINSFGGYVPSALRKILLSSAEEERPQRRELTVFFSDIRGFTNWSEKTDPDEVSEVLNEYLSAMAEIVENHGGTLDKFVGDCVMVFFGAPVKREDHASAALKMAWDMQQEVLGLNTKWLSQGRQAMNVGIGLNSGFVTFGNFGSTQFRDYTVIGREVNLAARIESHTPGGMILISQRTNAMVQDVAKTRVFAEINFKGIPEPVEVYEVLEVQGATPRSIAIEEQEWLCDETKHPGPYSITGLTSMLKSNRISSSTLIQKEGSDKKVELSQLVDKEP